MVRLKVLLKNLCKKTIDRFWLEGGGINQQIRVLVRRNMDQKEEN